MIGVSAVKPFMGRNGWELTDDTGPVQKASYLYHVYLRADPAYSGRASVPVPVLWDGQQETIVGNESSEIIRMFNSAFDDVGASGPDYYPERRHGEIGEINALVYDTVNSGVYKTGFARSQEAHEETYFALFDTLDRLEERLSIRRYLLGEVLTEADWRLFTTLVRFDPVHVGHFKWNRNRISDFPNLSGYSRELCQMPGISGAVYLDHVKYHYYASHDSINPTRIVPAGPADNLGNPHGRERLPAV